MQVKKIISCAFMLVLLCHTTYAMQSKKKQKTDMSTNPSAQAFLILIERSEHFFTDAILTFFGSYKDLLPLRPTCRAWCKEVNNYSKNRNVPVVITHRHIIPPDYQGDEHDLSPLVEKLQAIGFGLFFDLQDLEKKRYSEEHKVKLFQAIMSNEKICEKTTGLALANDDVTFLLADNTQENIFRIPAENITKTFPLRFPCLKEIWLDYAKIAEPTWKIFFEALQNQKNVEQLTFFGCENLSSQAIVDLHELPKLKKFHLLQCIFTEKSEEWQQIFEQEDFQNNIKSLAIGGYENFYDIDHNSTSVLVLKTHPELTKKSVASLTKLQYPEELYLTKQSYLALEILFQKSTYQRNLTKLFTDKEMKSSCGIEKLKNLREIYFCNKKKVPQDVWRKLSDSPHLQRNLRVIVATESAPNKDFLKKFSKLRVLCCAGMEAVSEFPWSPESIEDLPVLGKIVDNESLCKQLTVVAFYKFNGKVAKQLRTTFPNLKAFFVPEVDRAMLKVFCLNDLKPYLLHKSPYGFSLESERYY